MKLKEKHKNILKKAWKGVWQTTVILFITLLLFELIYRNYWFDFYRSELNALNPEEDLRLEHDKTILIFGDSFSADPKGWVKVLRDSLEDYNIINTAIPGTSVFHQSLFFQDRIKEFQPDKIIIQLYVGNDLIDYNRPQNFGKLSLTRNLFWWASDNLISLQYINYKLGRFKTPTKNSDPKDDLAFNPKRYNQRVKNYILSAPHIFQESINPSAYFDSEFEQLKKDLVDMINQVNVDASIQIIIIPAAFQVSEDQLANFKTLGATFDTNTLHQFTFFENIKLLEKDNEHLDVWSPLSSFRESNEQLYFPNDPHMNSKGQTKLGQLVLQTIK
ncbi:SGNH/GDSL hydrolase family protein [Parvicella tangerina]|uniref:SGNH hydrolase-type esterase domain-containing protein n=1 Tax=Parvicella tangerina TaxID=2829795 RepID=A0A916JIP3_9FLAO|nr:hypothetical protein [Parvicella tangerina]CAG5076357.1 hypothetical protein CRYO30217_00082 [Parvicella tangerina]